LQTKNNAGENIEQYVVNKLLASVPEALQLFADFPSLDEGRHVMLTRLQSEVSKQMETLALLRELLAEEQTAATDGSVSVATKHLQKHIELLNGLHTKAKEQVDLAQTEFLELCKYYGYTHAIGSANKDKEVSIGPETFFVEIKDLCKNIAEAVQVAQHHKAQEKPSKTKPSSCT
jgi:hypothetical protein